MEANAHGSVAANSRSSLWNVHCTVCGNQISGWEALKASGVRGFFYCPHCRSGLEMRGRLISAGILTILAGFLLWFAWYFEANWTHRTIGFVVAYSAEIFLFLLTIFFCLKVVIRVHRRDVDASFVL